MFRTNFLTVKPRATKSSTPFTALTATYLERCSKVIPAKWVQVKSSEEVMKAGGQPATWLMLLDSRGKQMTSEEFAARMDLLRNQGKRDLVVAIGPADGWKQDELKQADEVLSLGKMTLPHEMAALILAEQLYRACTILSGHPYHNGH